MAFSMSSAVALFFTQLATRCLSGSMLSHHKCACSLMQADKCMLGNTVGRTAQFSLFTRALVSRALDNLCTQTRKKAGDVHVKALEEETEGLLSFSQD